MKISVTWMLDHIQSPVSKLDVGFIVAKFNVHTAEIEQYTKFNLDLENLFLVRVDRYDQEFCYTYCEQLSKNIPLAFRSDAVEGCYFLVRRTGDTFSWELLSRYNLSKEGLFPAIDCKPQDCAGAWKDQCEESDYILDVDNKSINHRPDLWGHRGIAGEVAAFMGWQLKPLDQMLAKIDSVHADTSLPAAADHSLSLHIQDTQACSRFAALSCGPVTYKNSQIWMAMRLARVDSRPINSIVDLTNYVMLDISQPMHVFDADYFKDKRLSVSTGCVGQSLGLLDGRTITLTDRDIVVTNENYPVALAGVMGGNQGKFTKQSRAIIIEAGSFSASTVRNSATHHKITTESSTRFAKQLDPMQNVTALLRFVFLAQKIGVIGAITEKIASVGTVISPRIMNITHPRIEHALGIFIESEKVITMLESLQFKVHVERQDDQIVYHVTVPTARMTKDITIPEDIIEEVARVYGFENIAYKRPVRLVKSFDISPVMLMRSIKQYCAFAMKMREVRDYLFYDESFLQRLGWYPTDAVAVKNPVSENWKVLVTSLIPHLIKNVELNMPGHETINFFEVNNIWKKLSDQESLEKKSLAGLFFSTHTLDFYEYKAQLQSFFAALGMPITWEKPTEIIEPWFDTIKTADIMIDGMCIGKAGMVAPLYIRPVVKGYAFAFELDIEKIIGYTHAPKKYTSWSKYQTVSVDISLLIDASVSAKHLEQLIKQADKKIDRVYLIDFFEKQEWADKRSLTFRYRINDFQGNISKEVIDTISTTVATIMQAQGAQIRS